MLKLIESKILKKNGNAVKYIKINTYKKWNDLISKINFQIDRDFWLVWPMTLSTISENVHIIRWIFARELFIIENNVSRVKKEIIASWIAQINKCPYCEDVHTTSISSAWNNKVSKAIMNKTWESLNDKKTKEIIKWSLNTRKPNTNIIKNPPFSEKEAPEIIWTALVFHSTNRLVSIFLDNSPLPNFLSNNLTKKIALKIASKTFFKSMIFKKVKPLESLKFISNYDFWNKINNFNPMELFIKALKIEKEILDEIENKHIQINLIKLFKTKIAKWEGEDMPLGRAWLLKITKNLNENEKPIANIIFLSAFSPYTITKNDINDFLQIKKSEQELLEICFWSIQTLVNRINEWLIKPFLK